MYLFSNSSPANGDAMRTTMQKTYVDLVNVYVAEAVAASPDSAAAVAHANAAAAVAAAMPITAAEWPTTNAVHHFPSYENSINYLMLNWLIVVMKLWTEKIAWMVCSPNSVSNAHYSYSMRFVG